MLHQKLPPGHRGHPRPHHNARLALANGLEQFATIALFPFLHLAVLQSPNKNWWKKGGET